MTPFAALVLPPEFQDLYRRAKALVDAFPDKYGLRCHEVARAVAAKLPALPAGSIRVVDGTFGRGCGVDHSWLVLELSPYMAILDVYAVGAIPPVQLLDMFLIAGDRMYHPGPGRTDIRQDELDLLLSTNIPGTERNHE